MLDIEQLKQVKKIHVTYLRYHIGSASLVIFSFAFIIFFICKKNNHTEIKMKLTAVTHTHVRVVFYLHIDKIVEWVDVLLYQAFHLKDTQWVKN